MASLNLRTVGFETMIDGNDCNLHHFFTNYDSKAALAHVLGNRWQGLESKCRQHWHFFILVAELESIRQYIVKCSDLLIILQNYIKFD